MPWMLLPCSATVVVDDRHRHEAVAFVEAGDESRARGAGAEDRDPLGFMGALGQQLTRDDPAAAHVDEGQRPVDRQSGEGQAFAKHELVDRDQQQHRGRDADEHRVGGPRTQEPQHRAIQSEPGENRDGDEQRGRVQPDRHVDLLRRRSAELEPQCGDQCRGDHDRVGAQHDQALGGSRESDGPAADAHQHPAEPAAPFTSDHDTPSVAAARPDIPDRAPTPAGLPRSHGHLCRRVYRIGSGSSIGSYCR